MVEVIVSLCIAFTQKFLFRFRFMYIYVLFMKFIVEIHISSETGLSRDTHVEKSVSNET